jgi:hypothetical protein
MAKPLSVATLPVCLLAFVSLAPPSRTSLAQETGARTWIGHYREVEEYLRTAECVSLEGMSWSVPGAKRCVLRPGGPVARLLFKPLIPGEILRGFRQRYKAEIAAYELDKLLKLEMLPPAVERELQGYKGSATLWVEKLEPSSSGPPPNSPERTVWEKQLTRMLMFDGLIGNTSRNQGNTMRDSSWHLVLLDHGGAFSSGTDLPPGLTQIDRDLWARIEKLTRKELDAALGPWLDEGEIAAILARREKMRAAVRK